MNRQGGGRPVGQEPSAWTRRSEWPRCDAFKIIVGVIAVFCVDSAMAPHIVVSTTSAADFTANPVRLTDMDVSEFIRWAAKEILSQPLPPVALLGSECGDRIG